MEEAKIIQVDGYAFRDANGNGKLDLYEDWRQPVDVRAKALADELSAEEIIPLMWHNGFMSTAAPLDDDSVATLKEGMRAGVSRANADPDNYAGAIAWINAVQEWCEKNDPHGIPYMNSTDPYQLYDIPDNHCLVSCFDPELWKKSGRYTGRAWRATGARVNLGPQVDIGTNIVWTRLGGSICEDPAANRDLTKAFGGGMQSTWEPAPSRAAATTTTTRASTMSSPATTSTPTSSRSWTVASTSSPRPARWLPSCPTTASPTPTTSP